VDRIAENFRRIEERVARAAEGCGRRASDVRIVGVTKYADAPAARALAAAGCRELGESRPQELRAKAAALADLPVVWHLVGHLQRNKIRLTRPHVGLIHSVDSLRLIESLDDAYGSAPGAVIEVLLEVRVSPDETKGGLSPDEVPAILDLLPRFPQVGVVGLMTMASREGGPAVARREFARLRELRDRWGGDYRDRVSLHELSMGMSGDFEEAIREGATIIRVGSALFEGAVA
jgi:hypothetical protein